MGVKASVTVACQTLVVAAVARVVDSPPISVAVALSVGRGALVVEVAFVERGGTMGV